MRDGYHPIYALFLVQPSAIFLVKNRLTFFYSMYYNKKSGHPTPFCIPLVSLSELHSYTIWVYEILHYLSSSTLQFTHTSLLLLPFFGVNTSYIYSLSFLPFYFFAPPKVTTPSLQSTNPIMGDSLILFKRKLCVVDILLLCTFTSISTIFLEGRSKSRVQLGGTQFTNNRKWGALLCNLDTLQRGGGLKEPFGNYGTKL